MSQKLLKLTKGYQNYLKVLRLLPSKAVIERLDEKMKLKGSLLKSLEKNEYEVQLLVFEISERDLK